MAAVQEILKELRRLGSEENRAGMARFGIRAENAFGVPMGPLRVLAKRLGRDHTRAMKLWETGNREARLVAIFTADPKKLTPAEANQWVRSIDSWDICDGCAIHLFWKTPFAWNLVWRWSRRKPEFVRRSGFALLAALAVHDKGSGNEAFLETLALIEETSEDGRNFVKKAVNWALRQIGKRNAVLRQAAIATAERLAVSDHVSARWIGKDALRELKRVCM